MPAMSRRPWWERVLWVGAALAGLALVWEGYKVLGRFTDSLPVRSTNAAMPHVWDIVGSLFESTQQGGGELLLVTLLRSAAYTLREAAVGFLLGGSVGLLIAMVFVRSPLLERSFMPYVVASQTVPLIAIAPMVVIWLGRLGWPRWVPVTVISAYLAFFPVVINAVRGLRSPHPDALDLMTALHASPPQELWKLRLPASLPFLFSGLRVAANAAIVGAIIGELPAGSGEGLGRTLLTFNQYFSLQPERLFAAILVSALLGLLFWGVVVGLERLVVRGGATA